jgi:hypothetical protein
MNTAANWLHPLEYILIGIEAITFTVMVVCLVGMVVDRRGRWLDYMSRAATTMAVVILLHSIYFLWIN